VLIHESLGIEHFVNADAIARGISPFAPESVAVLAGRIMLQRMNELAEASESFAFESTLAGVGMSRWLTKQIARGYRLHVVFLWLPNADLAVARVAARVAEGGHSVEEAVIRRRYSRGVRNLIRVYLPMATKWRVYDGSGMLPELIAEGRATVPPRIVDQDRWNLIVEGDSK